MKNVILAIALVLLCACTAFAKNINPADYTLSAKVLESESNGGMSISHVQNHISGVIYGFWI